MEIKTKFSIGDKVFVLKDNKAKELEIKSVFCDEDGIRYSDDKDSFIGFTYPKHLCFATKDELIAYITSDDE